VAACCFLQPCVLPGTGHAAASHLRCAAQRCACLHVPSSQNLLGARMQTLGQRPCSTQLPHQRGLNMGHAGLSCRASSAPSCATTCTILCYDVYHSPEAVAMGAQYVSMEELLRRADIVSLHTPLMPETFHLINKDRWERWPGSGRCAVRFAAGG
jgi:hypothetical protein